MSMDEDERESYRKQIRDLTEQVNAEREENARLGATAKQRDTVRELLAAEEEIARLRAYIAAHRRAHVPTCPLAADDPKYGMYATPVPSLPACTCAEPRIASAIKVGQEIVARLRAALEAAKEAVNDGRGINSGNNMEFAEEFCAAIDKALRGEA